MSLVEMVRVRKACLQCIRAKAKCATSEQHPNECHRCIRLNKQCAFEIAAKKPGPGPKSRSRVRQLEQRVESLIDLIATKNNTTGAPDNTSPLVQVVTPESTIDTDTATEFSKRSTPRWGELPEFKHWDPVEAGFIDGRHAHRLVNEFQTSFVKYFPFVIVGDATTLRRDQPFLFHSILAVAAHGSPDIQHALSEEFRRQLGRVIEHSRKSLDILQGLLVFGAWYHAFYHPASQQLAIVVQLCVALVQDLGLSRRPKTNSGKDCVMHNRPMGTLHEKRAFLGTFFLDVLFSQAWRKRSTLAYTRWMSQCCDFFNDSSIPSDALIRPFVQASELLSRVSTYFSYDDVENAEIKGEMMLTASVNSFLADLGHMKESATLNPLLKHNTALSLIYLLTDINIHEISLHSSLWSTSDQHTSTATTPSFSLIRLKMLHRAMESAISYLMILLQTPQTQLYDLGLGSWAGWFYAVVVICKLVFLQDNERLGQAALEDITEEIANLIPPEVEGAAQPDDATTALESSEDHSDWSAQTVAREYNVRGLFDQFMEKLSCTLPANCAPWQKARDKRDSLYSIACIQKMMTSGLIKRFEGPTSSAPSHVQTAQPSTDEITNQASWQTSQPLQPDPQGQSDILSLPFSNFMHFDAINFDGITLPTSTFPQQYGQEILGDWMWNMVMDDFTMPTM